jgi:hypothetical protein
MVCEELMSGKLSLFIPTRNNASSVGPEQDRVLPNCGCVGATHVAMYEFIGVLMGVALRLGFPLPLRLPTLVWKQARAARGCVARARAVVFGTRAWRARGAGTWCRVWHLVLYEKMHLM